MTFIIIYQNIIRADIQGLHTKIKKNKDFKELWSIHNFEKKASKFQENP